MEINAFKLNQISILLNTLEEELGLIDENNRNYLSKQIHVTRCKALSRMIFLELIDSHTHANNETKKIKQDYTDNEKLNQSTQSELMDFEKTLKYRHKSEITGESNIVNEMTVGEFIEKLFYETMKRENEGIEKLSIDEFMKQKFGKNDK